MIVVRVVLAPAHGTRAAEASRAQPAAATFDNRGTVKLKSGFRKLAALCLLIIAVALATSSSAMQGDTIADIVLGQLNFTNNPQNFISGRGLHSPISVA